MKQSPLTIYVSGDYLYFESIIYIICNKIYDIIKMQIYRI